MTTKNITMYSTVSPSYYNAVRRNAVETYSVIMSSAGNFSPSGWQILLNPSSGGNYSGSARVDLAVDLTDLSFVDFSSAYMSFNPSYVSATKDAWGTSSRDSLVLVPQRESVRGLNESLAHYHEIYQGMTGGDYSNRVTMASMSAGSSFNFTFNSTGISYLNNVSTKTYHPGYAFFGIVFGGQADNVAPTIDKSPAIIGSNNPVLHLTFTSPAYINIGDSWKTVTSASINIGDSWKSVTDLDVNVGDNWKNI